MKRSIAATLVVLAVGELAHADVASGRRLLRKRHFPEAIAELTEAAANDPTGESTYELALAYDLSGDAPHAIEQYQKYLAAAPKGANVEAAQKYLALRQAETAEDAADAQAEADARAAAARAAQNAGGGADAQARVDAANRRYADAQQNLRVQGALRDGTRADVARAKRDLETTDAALDAWRASALDAPTGGGRGLRVLGMIGIAGGASLIAAGTWYGIDSRSISDKLSSGTLGAWTTDDDLFVARGERGDDQIKTLVPIGSVAVLLGAIAYGWGEAEATSRRSAADLRRTIEGGSP
ncbi:MAG TPA: hypothetical protein VL463_28695 [Kofleriaceae bacterium]|nr:hypothetical protein [Kofleriaceae bacterium]